MAWRMSGTYIATCSCSLICPCPVDGPPTGKGGKCDGLAVFHISRGNLDDVGLSGVAWAMWNNFPSNPSSGNWTMGLFVDASATDDQAKAIQRIVSGEEGGPFAEFVPLIGKFEGTERAKITFSDGDSPSATIEGQGELGIEVARGPDGSPTTVHGAMFGFAPVYRVGKAKGKAKRYDPVYAETADYEFSSEMAGEVHPRG